MKLKSLALTLTILVLASLAVGLSATLETSPAPDAPIAVSDAPPVCAAAAVLPFDTTAMWRGPNLCGDPCSNPGQEVGCINKNVEPWERTFCICTNGYLTC